MRSRAAQGASDAPKERPGASDFGSVNPSGTEEKNKLSMGTPSLWGVAAKSATSFILAFVGMGSVGFLFSDPGDLSLKSRVQSPVELQAVSVRVFRAAGLQEGTSRLGSRMVGFRYICL